MRTRLKDARNASGLNQKEAAARLGVSIGTYRNWEQGRVVMNGEQLVSAARLFNTNVDYLLMTDSPDAALDESSDELLGLFDSMNSEGRDVLLVVARALAERFGKEEA